MDQARILAERIGSIVLAHTELDERLVQVLIELLEPLPAASVQLLVGSRSLVQKCDLISSLAKTRGVPLHDELSGGESAHELLKRIKNLNSLRDRAVHSYYDSVELRRFRSRQPTTETVTIDELQTLSRELSICSDDLHEFAARLAIRSSQELNARTRLGQITQGVHEIITAGHLHERGLLDALVDRLNEGLLIRFAIEGVEPRFLDEGESPTNKEFSVEISRENWLASITTPAGELFQLGDTGWRDVTVMAQEDDTTVESAMIRRIGNQVHYSFEGGDLAKAPWHQPHDRLAERAFGSTPATEKQLPSWLTGLEGFAPSVNQEDSAVDGLDASLE